MRVPLVFACLVAFGVCHAFPLETLDHPVRGRKACAALDLNLLELIEEHGHAEEVDGVVLFHSVEIMLQARQHCLRGRFEEAVSLYSGVSLGPVRTKSLR